MLCTLSTALLHFTALPQWPPNWPLTKIAFSLPILLELLSSYLQMGVRSKGVVFPLKAFSVFLLPTGSNLQKVPYLGGGGHMQYLKIPGTSHLACPYPCSFPSLGPTERTRWYAVPSALWPTHIRAAHLSLFSVSAFPSSSFSRPAHSDSHL